MSVAPKDGQKFKGNNGGKTSIPAKMSDTRFSTNTDAM